MFFSTARRKTEALSRQSEREEIVAEDIRRADTPIDKLSFSMWNSVVPDQEPTNVRRNKHLQMSLQREDQEAVFDPECLDRDPFMLMGRQGPRGRPKSAAMLHHPSGAGRKATFGSRPQRSQTPDPYNKPNRLPRSMTPGWEGQEIAAGQRGTTGTLLWRVSGQANNLKKNADTEYWDHCENTRHPHHALTFNWCLCSGRQTERQRQQAELERQTASDRQLVFSFRLAVHEDEEGCGVVQPGARPQGLDPPVHELCGLRVEWSRPIRNNRGGGPRGKRDLKEQVVAGSGFVSERVDMGSVENNARANDNSTSKQPSIVGAGI